MQDFRNVDIWVKAHALVLRTYTETQSLPKEETFGLTLQLRKSAVGIATRIAEGSGRPNNGEYVVDLRRAAAGCNEFEYLVVLARDLKYWAPEAAGAVMEDAIEVRKMIFGLLRKM